MKKQLVFIDESGDPGLKRVSSDNFVMAAAVFVDSKEAESVMHEIDYYRESLGWKYNHEFKFTKNPKSIVLELLKRLDKYNYEVYAVYVQKDDFRRTLRCPSLFIDKEKFYNWMIKRLLQLIPLDKAKITIDGRSSKQNMNKAKTYFRREFNNDGIKIESVKFEDSVRTNLLQLADLVVGSINRSLQPNKTDSKEYISVIRNKVVKIEKIDFG